MSAQEDGWPLSFETNGYTFTMYSPGVTAMNGTTVQGRTAFSVHKDQANMVFGAFSYTAEFGEGASGSMSLEKFAITAMRLPDSLVQYEDKVTKAIEDEVIAMKITSTKSQLQAAAKAATGGQDVFKNDPPKIIIRENPAILVVIDGEPKFKSIEKTPYEFVVNTATPLFRDKGQGMFYLPNGKDWYSATAIKGVWKKSTNVPQAVQDLIDPESIDQEAKSTDVEVVVSQEPAELISFDGLPRWEPLPKTDLLYAANTESDIFKVISTQETFVLLAGRWFSSMSMDGPWKFIEADDLPPAFKSVPSDSKKADVLVSVAGTPEAEQALLDNEVPKTATVDRDTKLEVTYTDGDPYWHRAEGSAVDFAVNASTTVLRIDNKYYAVDNGIWFISNSPKGPWTVSDSRPPEVDNIPDNSPVASVKHVYVYSSTPTVVYVGYTPAYYGVYPMGPTVVYGTGWHYHPWYGPHYYPGPPTYGFHVHFSVGVGWGWGGGYYRPPMYRYPSYRRPAHYNNVQRRVPSNTRATPRTNVRSNPSVYNRSSNPHRATTRQNVPSGSVRHPTTRPSNRSTMRPTNRSSMSRPSSRPATRGGGRRR